MTHILNMDRLRYEHHHRNFRTWAALPGWVAVLENHHSRYRQNHESCRYCLQDKHDFHQKMNPFHSNEQKFDSHHCLCDGVGEEKKSLDVDSYVEKDVDFSLTSVENFPSHLHICSELFATIHRGLARHG
jgi:hypothetical protein